MAEYIEREALKRALRVWITECMIDGDNEIADGFRDCIDLIDDCPAADVAPVRHGQWERIGIIGRKGLQIYPCCSACGMVSAAYRSEWEGLRGAWKFCPNCGAKMGADTQEREGV